VTVPSEADARDIGVDPGRFRGGHRPPAPACLTALVRDKHPPAPVRAHGHGPSNTLDLGREKSVQPSKLLRLSAVLSLVEV
jgi:hypothetical protein